jgi:hypothetical protein
MHLYWPLLPVICDASNNLSLSLPLRLPLCSWGLLIVLDRLLQPSTISRGSLNPSTLNLFGGLI